MVAPNKTAIRSAILLSLGGLCVLTLSPTHQAQLGVVLAALACIFWFFLAPLRLKALNATSGSWPLACLLIFAAWISLVQVHRLGPSALLVAMAIVWVADVGAYFVGRAVGKRKLAPKISPGKSWEGVWGGMFLVVICALFAAAAPDLKDTLPAQLVSRVGPILAGLVLAILAAYSVVGDLHESLLKRQANVKDSSNLLPGHGGVLDRIDALLPTMPAVFLIHQALSLAGKP
jgi:phosphatidate cytidylyltransferase